MKFACDPAKDAYKASLFAPAFSNRKGLFSKYHSGGIKLNDPCVNLGSVGTYEWSILNGTSKFTFKKLDQDDTCVTARNRSDGGQSLLVTKKAPGGFTVSSKMTIEKGGERNMSCGIAGDLMDGAYKFNAKVHPQRLIDGGKASAKHDVKCSASYKVPGVDGLSVVCDVKAKCMGNTFCHHNTGLIFTGVDNLKIGASANHSKDLTADCTYTINDSICKGIEVGALVQFNSDSKKLGWAVGGAGHVNELVGTAQVKVNHQMQLAVQTKRNVNDNFAVTLGSICDLKEPQALITNYGVKMNFKL